MRKLLSICALLLAAMGSPVLAQKGPWEMQNSTTTANLRGIHEVGGGVAWASGTNGTVLRTEDSGYMWQSCAMPPGAEKLDFRGIWAWDANTAIVMSSGPGDQSRLYKTVDGCSHWKLQESNPDKDGFWDSMGFQSKDFGMLGDTKTGVVIGDPVKGRFATRVMLFGAGWLIDGSSCAARPNEAAFAASNSSVFVFGSRRYIIGTGGKSGPHTLLSPLLAYRDSEKPCLEVSVPLASGTDSAGVFSLAFRDSQHGVAVGGDYQKPNETNRTAAWTADGGRAWTAASKPPHGYRSAVAFDSEHNAWIAVGPNGTDVSYDDGKTWSSLDAGNWNALSLPWVVGPGGRMAKLVSLEPATRLH